MTQSKADLKHTPFEVVGVSLLVFEMGEKYIIPYRVYRFVEEKPWRDKERFEELYLEEQMPFSKMAEKWGCGTTTLSNWAKRHGIETRGGSGREKADYASFFTITSRNHAYEVWDDNDASTQVRVHRLVMVAEHGFDAVTQDVDVHHKNGVCWDNRPCNLEILPCGEHTRLHSENRTFLHDENGQFAGFA